MKTQAMLKMVLLGAVLVAATHALASHVQSLRGDIDPTEDTMAPEIQYYNKDGQPIDRDYLQQPPLIPHKIDAYRITIKHNKCLSCHSWQNYKSRNATKISQTHFESRDGLVLANVSARRYFCTQCHVPQTNAKPLVENEFTPVKALRH